jgi:uncharacterized protein (TIGR02246 family)
MMKLRHLAVVLAIGFAALAVPRSAVGQSAAERAIREVQAKQADAWNHHDAAAYAALFTKDGDVVNVVGWWWKGRAEIERKLAAAFAFVFRESTMSITDVQVRLLKPDLAVAHVQWTMTGAKMPPGMPEPREGIQLQVLTKSGGRWMIASFQNTNSVPERPFPTGPVNAGTPPAKP